MPLLETARDYTPRPLLNFDILFVIMGFLDLQDTSRMMRTCWTMYRGGSKYLLDDVRIHSEGHAISFCYFMFAEKRFRFRYLRHLTLLLGSISEPVARTLIAVLRRAVSHLEVLNLSPSDPFLDSATDLPDAVASLTSLRSLSVSLADITTCVMLSKLHAPISRLNLEYVPSLDEYGASFVERANEEAVVIHPLTVCSAFSSTLEELHFTFEHYLERIPRPRSAPVYPRLRTLRLDEDWLDISPYIAATPCVTKLILQGVTDPLYDTLQMDPELMSDIREDNKQAQLADGSWTCLQELDAELLMAYLCGLICQVPRVTLSHINLHNARLLRKVLRDVRPTWLTFSVQGYLFCTLDWHIPEMLIDEGSASLTHLVIRWDLRKKDWNQDVRLAVVSQTVYILLRYPDSIFPKEPLVASLGSLGRIEYFDITIGPDYDLNPTSSSIYWMPSSDETDNGIEDTNLPHPPPTPEPLRPVELSMEALDVLEFAQKAMHAAPTMKEVFVSVIGPQDRKYRRSSHIRREKDGKLSVIAEGTK